jgi:hypothetical protein
MARAKADLPVADDVRALVDDEGRLALRVTPGARSESASIDGERLLVKVRAKPEGGAANAAVIKLVAKVLGVAPTQVELLRGATGRDKLVRVAR